MLTPFEIGTVLAFAALAGRVFWTVYQVHELKCRLAHRMGYEHFPELTNPHSVRRDK